MVGTVALHEEDYSLLSCERWKLSVTIRRHHLMSREVRFVPCRSYQTTATMTKGNLLASALLLTIPYVLCDKSNAFTNQLCNGAEPAYRQTNMAARFSLNNWER